MNFYKISYGTGFYWMANYVVKVDRPTTDFGALTDILIDYLVENDKRNILDMQNVYMWDEKGEKIVRRDDPTWSIFPDEYVSGGNCGDVLMHYGSFDISEISESEIGDLTVIDWS